MAVTKVETGRLSGGGSFNDIRTNSRDLDSLKQAVLAAANAGRPAAPIQWMRPSSGMRHTITWDYVASRSDTIQIVRISP